MELEDPRVINLGRLVARAQDRAEPYSLAAAQRRLLAAHAERQWPARRSTGAWVFAGGGLLAAAAAIAFVVVASRPSDAPAPPPVAVAPPVVTPLEAPAEAENLVVLPGGAMARLLPGSRAHLTGGELSALTLESGALHALVQRTEGVFFISAGPFLVETSFGCFEASWDPATERLTVSVKDGEAVVIGGCLTSPQRVEIGSPALFACKGGALAAPPAVPAGAAARSAINALPADAPTGWEEALSRGDPKKALEVAEALGFDRICDSVPPAKLIALAEVARLAGNVDRAREALLSVRLRAPGTSLAANAAFELGKLTFNRKGACHESSGWFMAYLREAPDGAFVMEAHGRVLEVARRSADKATAEAMARDYLERWPRGPDAPLAKEVLAL